MSCKLFIANKIIENEIIMHCIDERTLLLYTAAVTGITPLYFGYVTTLLLYIDKHKQHSRKEKKGKRL